MPKVIMKTFDDRIPKKDEIVGVINDGVDATGYVNDLNKQTSLLNTQYEKFADIMESVCISIRIVSEESPKPSSSHSLLEHEAWKKQFIPECLELAEISQINLPEHCISHFKKTGFLPYLPELLVCRYYIQEAHIIEIKD